MSQKRSDILIIFNHNEGKKKKKKQKLFTEMMMPSSSRHSHRGQGLNTNVVYVPDVQLLIFQVFANVPSRAENSVGFLVNLPQMIIIFRFWNHIPKAQAGRKKLFRAYQSLIRLFEIYDKFNIAYICKLICKKSFYVTKKVIKLFFQCLCSFLHVVLLFNFFL